MHRAGYEAHSSSCLRHCKVYVCSPKPLARAARENRNLLSLRSVDEKTEVLPRSHPSGAPLLFHFYLALGGLPKSELRPPSKAVVSLLVHR